MTLILDATHLQVGSLAARTMQFANLLAEVGVLLPVYGGQYDVFHFLPFFEYQQVAYLVASEDESILVLLFAIGLDHGTILEVLQKTMILTAPFQNILAG